MEYAGCVDGGMIVGSMWRIMKDEGFEKRILEMGRKKGVEV